MSEIFAYIFVSIYILITAGYIWHRYKGRKDAWQGKIMSIEEDTFGDLDSSSRWFKIIVKLSDGSVKHVEINKKLYEELSVNDSLIKKQGELFPQKVNFNK